MARIIPPFTPETRRRCANFGIDIDASYAELLLEIRVGGPTVRRVLRDIGAPLPRPLTERQAEIVGLLLHGLNDSEVGAAIGIEPGSVSEHVRHAMDRTGCRTRAQLTAVTLARALIDDHLGQAA